MVSQEKDRDARIALLKKWDSIPLRTILKGAFDPQIKWALPEGELPYQPVDAIGAKGMLYQESRKLYRFLEGGNPNLSEEKMVELFCRFLGSLDPADADLMNCVKDKKLPYKPINVTLVNDAFPGLLSHVKK
jgi:hypothetical protein